MAKWALVYVPTGCANRTSADGGCRVHVNYHGCMNLSWQRRRLWANSLNINEYAEVRIRAPALGARRGGCSRAGG